MSGQLQQYADDDDNWTDSFTFNQPDAGTPGVIVVCRWDLRALKAALVLPRYLMFWREWFGTLAEWWFAVASAPATVGNRSQEPGHRPVRTLSDYEESWDDDDFDDLQGSMDGLVKDPAAAVSSLIIEVAMSMFG
jgi:hypothetical protein